MHGGAGVVRRGAARSGVGVVRRGGARASKGVTVRVKKRAERVKKSWEIIGIRC